MLDNALYVPCFALLRCIAWRNRFETSIFEIYLSRVSKWGITYPYWTSRSTKPKYMSNLTTRCHSIKLQYMWHSNQNNQSDLTESGLYIVNNWEFPIKKTITQMLTYPVANNIDTDIIIYTRNINYVFIYYYYGFYKCSGYDMTPIYVTCY